MITEIVNRLGFLFAFADRVPLAFEIRHPGWFTHEAHRAALFSCFEEHGVVGVLTDVAGRRDVLHMRTTAPETMLRLVGNTSDATDYSRVEDWVERIARWIDDGLQSAFVFLHQRSDPGAVDLARHFALSYRNHTGLDVLPALPPPPTVQRQGELF